MSLNFNFIFWRFVFSMFFNTFFRRVLFNLTFLTLIFLIAFTLFHNIYTSNSIIISFAVHPFNICERYPKAWFYIKIIYIFSLSISSIICINIIYSYIFSKKSVREKEVVSVKSSGLSLKIHNFSNKNIVIPESRTLSKLFDNRNYWLWKNKLGYVSIY